MTISAKALCLLALAATVPAHATDIVGDASGVVSSRFQFFWGQSFTTPAGTGWDHISVNFYDLTLNPLALGTGYLFDAPYAGTPAGLAAATALAVSAPGDGSHYAFAPAFRLRSVTQYYFFADAAMRLRGGGTGTIGGTSVFAQFGFQPFASAGGKNADFQVSGSILAVPEPASWAMLTIGFASAGLMLRRRRPIAITTREPQP